jgi:hypothetical protein
VPTWIFRCSKCDKQFSREITNEPESPLVIQPFLVPEHNLPDATGTLCPGSFLPGVGERQNAG